MNDFSPALYTVDNNYGVICSLGCLWHYYGEPLITFPSKEAYKVAYKANSGLGTTSQCKAASYFATAL